MNIKKWDVVRYEGQEGVVQQIFKSGLYLVEFRNGTQIRTAKKNLELIRAYDPANNPFPVWSNRVA